MELVKEWRRSRTAHDGKSSRFLSSENALSGIAVNSLAAIDPELFARLLRQMHRILDKPSCDVSAACVYHPEAVWDVPNRLDVLPAVAGAAAGPECSALVRAAQIIQRGLERVKILIFRANKDGGDEQ